MYVLTEIFDCRFVKEKEKKGKEMRREKKEKNKVKKKIGKIREY